MLEPDFRSPGNARILATPHDRSPGQVPTFQGPRPIYTGTSRGLLQLPCWLKGGVGWGLLTIRRLGKPEGTLFLLEEWRKDKDREGIQSHQQVVL